MGLGVPDDGRPLLGEELGRPGRPGAPIGQGVGRRPRLPGVEPGPGQAEGPEDPGDRPAAALPGALDEGQDLRLDGGGGPAGLAQR